MKHWLLAGVIGICLAVVGLAFAQDMPFGNSTIRTLDQTAPTSTPYEAVTTRTYGKNVYLPGSHASTTDLTVLSLTASRCVETDADGKLVSASAVCGSGSGGGGAAWEELFTNALTPTTTTAGIFVNASSTFNDTLRLNSTLTFSDTVAYDCSSLGNNGKLTVDANGLVDCAADATGGGTGSNWSIGGAQTFLTPSTSTYGINLTASSTFASGLTVRGGLNATSSQIDTLVVNTSLSGTGFDDAWDSAFSATTTWAHFTINWNTLHNATTTYPGFQTQFDTALNATTTLDLTTFFATNAQVGTALNLSGASITNYFGTACSANNWLQDIGDDGAFSCGALDVTGDWTGTLDNLEAASFLRSDAADTGTGLLTLSGGVNITASSTFTNGLTIRGGLNSTSTLADTLTIGTSLIIDSSTFDSLTDDATLSNNSGDLQVVDVTCSDCLNATEIEDIYLLLAGDSSSGNYTWTGTQDFQGVSTTIATLTVREGLNATSSVIDTLTVPTTLNLSGATITNFFGTACAGNNFLQDIGDDGAFSCGAASGSGGGAAWEKYTGLAIPASIITPTTTNASIYVSGNSTTTASVTFTDYVSCTALETDANGLVVCGSDAVGAAGTGSNWVFGADQTFITPSTTVGILTQASSTIGDTLSVEGQIFASDGVAEAPAYSFADDTDTGIFRNGLGLHFTFGGTERVEISTTAFKSPGSTGEFSIDYTGSSVTTPAYSFVGDTNTGLYRIAADVLGLTTGGTERFRISSLGATTTGSITFTDYGDCTLKTDSNGLVLCGTDATGGGTGSNWTPKNIAGKFLTPSTTPYGISITASSTIDILTVRNGLNATTSRIDTLVIPTSLSGTGFDNAFDTRLNATTTLDLTTLFATNAQVGTALNLSGASITNYFGTACSANNWLQDISDAGVFSCGALDVTGDWTGTLDNLEAASFLRSDADDTGTGILTLSGGINVTASSTFTNGLTVRNGLNATTSLIDTLTLTNALTVANGGTGVGTFTDHGVLIGSGTSAITALTVGTNGQILVGSTGADPVFATLNCADNLTCTTGAGTLQIDVDDDFLLNTGDTGAGLFVLPDLRAATFNSTSTLVDALTVNGTASTTIQYIGPGDVTAPGLAFGNDTDTGLFWTQANRLSFAAGGTLEMYIDQSGIVVTNGATSTALAITGLADCVVKTDSNGSAGCITKTKRSSVLGWNTLPTSTGEVWFEPYTISATNDRWRHGNWVFNTGSTRDELYGAFSVPKDYATSSAIILAWTSTGTSGNVVWDFAYRCAAVGESFDQTGDQQATTTTAVAPASTDLRVDSTFQLTDGNFTADDICEWELARDQADAADTLAADALLFGAYFQYGQ